MHKLIDEQTEELIAITGGLNQAGRVINDMKKLSMKAAKLYISDQLGEASDELVLGLLGFVPEYVVEVDLPKGKLYSILWVCGATLGQLSSIFGINRSSVHSSMHKYLSPQTRTILNQARSNHTINKSPTEISAYYAILNSWLSSEDREKFLRYGDVERIALAIIQTYNEEQRLYEEGAPSPYDEFDDVKTRIGQ